MDTTVPGAPATLITREAIRRFAVTLGTLNPIHHDVATARRRGFRDLVAPPFFFTTVGMSMGRLTTSDRLRADGMPLEDELTGRVVAGETSVRWYGPIVAGDEVSAHQELRSEQRKTGRSGPLTLFTYSKTYFVDDRLVVAETLVRIGR
ncbi:FAS1-like dehydratase domain-containing protein [Actinacidiphila sp. ITFR-21]|uniref:FAS1-like dehydratase domain-containing protein n=1 Tax=Actinacidiphila sp. ITFR-21 TaxID=3075199 RepID=UPI002889DF09|nr:MaoC family dehydratase N-terminal domain-containing protein [Streptomyces sp. ITFR-21]WNI19008.1 MaoC family dehydratase N-terminal domain-containing protein [Streptomyces sp. ITFR-21]